MPSRAEVRSGLEHTLRAVSIVLLASLVWLSLDRGRPESVVSARSGNLGKALADWSKSGLPPGRIHVELDSTLSPSHRDWLRALSGAGSKVGWSGENLTPLAVSTQQVAAPRGGIKVLAASGKTEHVRLFDEIGALDTAEVRAGGAVFSIPSANGLLGAQAGASIARAPLPDSVRVGRVLVLGTAGWESKFVIAALEEDGWSVDASLYVAPGVSVTQGAVSPLDTSRYSAVVAIDGAAAARSGEISRYVASGGGLVIAAAAGGIDGFSALRPGSPGRVQAPATLSSESAPTTLRSLRVIPAAALRPDAIPLDRRGATTVAAARRHMYGRVLQHGYLETWRWRMSGGDESLHEHREWWTRAVASVAYAPVIPGDAVPADTYDDAPFARLVGALGPASAHSGPGLASAAASVSLWWLAAALALSLLGEWASRRLRGMK